MSTRAVHPPDEQLRVELVRQWIAEHPLGAPLRHAEDDRLEGPARRRSARSACPSARRRRSARDGAGAWSSSVRESPGSPRARSLNRVVPVIMSRRMSSDHRSPTTSSVREIGQYCACARVVSSHVPPPVGRSQPAPEPRPPSSIGPDRATASVHCTCTGARDRGGGLWMADGPGGLRAAPRPSPLEGTSMTTHTQTPEASRRRRRAQGQARAPCGPSATTPPWPGTSSRSSAASSSTPPGHGRASDVLDVAAGTRQRLDPGRPGRRRRRRQRPHPRAARGRPAARPTRPGSRSTGSRATPRRCRSPTRRSTSSCRASA